jgi:hypothetical protein
MSIDLSDETLIGRRVLLAADHPSNGAKRPIRCRITSTTQLLSGRIFAHLVPERAEDSHLVFGLVALCDYCREEFAVRAVGSKLFACPSCFESHQFDTVTQEASS